MRRVMHDRFGGPEVLELREVDEPHAGAGEVRIRVEAAALNPVDWKIFGGGPAATTRGLEPPLGVGNDIAGTIDEVGDDVRGWAVGDRVFGSARTRALQDWTVVDPDAERLARIPDGLDAGVAASLVVAGRTAWDAVGRLVERQGDTLFVHGAAGGVGQLAVQLAERKGARVIGSASERNHDMLRRLGVEPVAYGEGLAERLLGMLPVDACFDCADGAGVAAGLEAGVPIERCIAIAVKGAHGAAGVATDLARTGALDELAALAAAGALLVPIEVRYPLERFRDAYRQLMEGHARGKLVLDLMR
ncbi:NADP-dependent oxidoreductase [Agrococcus jenensis]|uniref:NADPH:quinone reductase-like Zn-dependent oxidoreductase n=1 Tax=Agrococcus jenensis TaxID=46353 RepID=A0A3N2APL0_9MICO|nr:NADP-dependent oxidoreductase [Agrococcus jenensis]ROR64983.1 NADPH:quinone reductase-like Zn-dependent oxidoreductase [Agrococcus jenensis]